MQEVIKTILIIAILIMGTGSVHTPPTRESGQVYVVNGSDTLESVAYKCYGDTRTWPVIWLATNAKATEDDRFSVIPDANQIEVGQKLWIPVDYATAMDPEVLELQAHGISQISPYEIRPVPAFMGEYDMYCFSKEGLWHLPNRLIYADGIPTARERGHPVRMAFKGLRAVNVYMEYHRDPNRDEYLEGAKGVADFLIEENGVIMDGALMFRYQFDHKHYRAPWYSGLAQGAALGFFCDLYQVTGDSKYLEAADMTFRSFFRFSKTPYKTDDWISYVDEEGYYWIEEYPKKFPRHVLNGFQYALAGLHKYWMLTHSAASEFLIKASLATISKHAEGYRNEGWISSKRLKRECRDFNSVKDNYHIIHIGFFRYLYLINGDPDLYRAAHMYEWDRIKYERIRENTGALTITIFPQEAVDTGAAWRRANASQRSSLMDYYSPTYWFKSGDTESYIVSGDYRVEFKPIGPHWETPANIQVTITAQGSITATALYVRKYTNMHFEPGEWEELVAKYKQTLTRDPNDTWAYFALGQLYQAKREMAQAEPAYLDAIGADRRNALAHVYLARLYVGQGKMQKAIEKLKETIRLCPLWLSIHAELADVYSVQGRISQALEEYRNSIDSPPNTAEYHYDLALLLRSKSLPSEAIAEFRQAISLIDSMDVKDSETLRLLGSSYQKIENPEEAIIAYQEAVRMAPWNSNGRLSLGNLYRDKGLIEEAIAQYRETARFHPTSPKPYIRLGRLYAKEGNIQEAIEAYRRAIKVAPKHTTSYYCSLGQVYESEGRLEEAEALYQQAAKIFPSSPQPYIALGDLYVGESELEKAISMYEKALETEPGADPARQKLEKAISMYEKALETSSEAE